MEPISKQTSLARAVAALDEAGCSCAVVTRGGTLFRAEGMGVGPLLDFLRGDRDFLRGASVADKIVGRAAALLLLGGGAVSVYGAVMSRSARAVLEDGGAAAFCGEEAAYIENRAHTGLCPLEEAVAGLDDPAEAFALLERRVAALRAGA